MREPTLEAAQGRWRELLPALGVPVGLLNGKHHPCPLCGGKDRFRFTDIKGEGDYYCNVCGSGPGVRLVMKLRGWDFRTAAGEIDKLLGILPPPNSNGHAKWVASPAELAAMWRAARTIRADDPVGLYLSGRKIDIAGLDVSSLRYVPALLHYPSGTRHPAMVARMSDADGKGVQIHRTYLTQDGRKAVVDPVRMFMPGELPWGGAVRLGVACAEIGVAEGIETALSAAMIHRIPVWAAMSDRMLMQWKPPPEAARVIVFGDSDLNYCGQAAAYALAKRLVFEAKRRKLDLAVTVLLPEQGKDWNDALRESPAPAGQAGLA